MSTAEVTPRASDGERPAPTARSSVPPASPAVHAGWLLRTAAIAAVAAGALWLVIAPGIRGRASEYAVVAVDWGTASLSYFLVAVLVSLVLWGGIELARTRGVGLVARIALIGGSALVVASSSPALRERLPWFYAFIVAAGAVIGAVGGGVAAARAPHTRAVSGVLLALALAAVARLAAWVLATAASDRASVQLYGMSRGLATAGFLFEACAHMVAVTWLWTRGRTTGQLGATAAVIGAYVVTWGVAHGVHQGAAPWQAALYTALADSPGTPSPYGLDAVATFLVPSSLLLALVAAGQPRQVAAVVAPMALALVSRGVFDSPLRALCAVTASQWAALACADERSMWRTLLDDRKRRLAEEGLEEPSKG